MMKRVLARFFSLRLRTAFAYKVNVSPAHTSGRLTRHAVPLILKVI